MMVAGEYAVLEGAEAIVAAVDRRAFARLQSERAPSSLLSLEAAASLAEAEKRLGRLEADVTLDVSRMREAGLKLGLGSSAAGAAAVAGLVYAAHGRELSQADVRREVLEAAFSGHSAVAPSGSGADVAAAVHGGFVRFRRLGDAIETHPIVWPAGLSARVVWTGQEARTSDFLKCVEGLARRDPHRHRAVMAALGSEAERFVSALLAQDLVGVVEATGAYGHAMGELGEAAGIEIVTDTLARVAGLAERAGGAAKPSGAGGGDVALAVFADPQAAERFEQLCGVADLRVLSIELGAPGVRVEPPSSEAA
jgi:phosphomevalonate kinase